MKRLKWFIIGASTGLVAGYFLDPSIGRRRRAQFNDRRMRLQKNLAWYIERQARNLNNHVRGFISELTRPNQAPSDDILIQRIRAEMGHKVRNVKSIEVIAENGEVTLKGPILAEEVDRLYNCVRNVPGVTRVINELNIHHTPDHTQGQMEGKPSFETH